MKKRSRFFLFGTINFARCLNFSKGNYEKTPTAVLAQLSMRDYRSQKQKNIDAEKAAAHESARGAHRAHRALRAAKICNITRVFELIFSSSAVQIFLQATKRKRAAELTTPRRAPITYP
ncbi:MAG: hypothetical protein IKO42_01165 [Opitutales bacterium]|nr:hypothetical protein [Opitutales bacterium]